MNLKILLIVPTLNTYKLLDRLINSLINQSYKNWRVVFVDASDDKDHIDFLEKLKNNDSRFLSISQNLNKYQGIYGAMNQGLEIVEPDEWTLFWGSDDFLPCKNTFNNLVKEISSYKDKDPYILIGRARYIDLKSFKPRRKSIFINKKNIVLSSRLFAYYMFLGSSPPHQGTIFSPKSIKVFKFFNTKFNMAADLEFFLKTSLLKNINIPILESEIVNIGLGGYSSISTRKRLCEVFMAYYERFGFLAFIPFTFRYFKRLLSKLKG